MQNVQLHYRRRAPDNQDTDVTTKEPTNYDSTFDPIEDINAGEVSTGTRRRRSVSEKRHILIIWCG